MGLRSALGSLAGFLAAGAPSPAFAASTSGGHSVIYNIALALVAASLFGLLARFLRQPLLLGYILAGVAIGPVGLGLIREHTDIVTISEIGLILLLFMIGLEIDLKKMMTAGRWVVVPGVLQVPLSAALAYAAFGWLEAGSLDLGGGSYARLYVALAVSLSSTMIVVKLLFDKMELDTLPGRITVGILVFQDLWAIIALAVQPNVDDPELGVLVRTFAMGALLVGVALLASRYVLPAIFRAVAQIPELLLVLSLGWCFLVSLVAAHPWVGLSMEMGALIAGVSLATFPYNLDVVAKAVSVRDFFITLFFVALGMQIPVPTLTMLGVALAVATVALLTRLAGVFAVLYAMRGGHRASLLATLNLSQVSEFSLVILALGIPLGHVGQDTLAIVLWVFSVLAVVSTYLVTYSHAIQSALSRGLSALGLRDLGEARETSSPRTRHPVVMLGFFRIAGAFLDEVARQHPHLLKQIKVIDFNPRVQERLEDLGVTCVYGDVGHPDTLQHAGVQDAQFVLSTVPDSFLKGTNNRKLVTVSRNLCPGAKLIAVAETVSQARELYDAGADYVLEVSHVAGDFLVAVLEGGLLGELPRFRDSSVHGLQQRRELVG